ncbi:MAG: chitobiase/beta-hexosaminidase C-terminal domain-containing protein [Clostridiales bacterium]|nr:chitobiase/beta-hexosaminidase C-terminal domain-containing protein [Clostridiales bacterium]
MFCKHCGAMVPNNATVCEQCGGVLTPAGSGKGVAGMRQGRPDARRAASTGSERATPNEPLYPDAPLSERRRRRYEGDAGRPDSRRGLLPEETGAPARRVDVREKMPRVHRFAINWAMVGLIAAVAVLFAGVGFYAWLKTTDEGQLILARQGKSVNADALWALGTEYLDQGYIERSIEVYEQAWAQEPDREDLYDKLLLLTEAYEAGGYLQKAEDTYRLMYETLAPENPVAYRNNVRLLTAQGRTPELADFLKLAYEKTGENSFIKQREEMLPAAPTADLPGGSYKLENTVTKEITLQSDEGYDIYYLVDGTAEDTLPEAGQLYTGPVSLGEGGHTIRAVAVSSELVSDETSVSYVISLPVPESPKCSLAPNDYETRQRVWLRHSDMDNVTIYYTIDGQSPTSNSPIYTGEPIQLPVGRVHIKAVAVNRFGKVSNEMDVEVKIKLPVTPKYFNTKDTFNDFTLLSTTRDRFVSKFGTPTEETEITDVMPSTCLKLAYGWGEARFYPSEKGYVLYRLETDSTSIVGPRSTRVSMKETTVTGKFRDMGQLNDQNGDRSIYYDDQAGAYAKLYKLSDDTARIDYAYTTDDGGRVTLSYYLTGGVVARMGISYTP